MSSNKYDKNWKTIGHVSDDGKTVHDENWNVIGHVSDDGKTIHDKNWSVTGHLSDDRKTLYDKEWNTVGHVSDDGKTIYDKNWSVTERSDRPSRIAYTPSSSSSYRSSSGEGNWVVWLIGALIVLAIIYLIFVVVVPFIILNISIIALVGSFIVAKKRRILQWSSLIGFVYLFFDIQAHWLSHHLVKNIEVSNRVIDYVFYGNTIAGLTAAFLVLRDWLRTNYSLTNSSNNTKLDRIVSRSTRRDVYVAGGLIVIAAGLILLHNSSTRGGNSLSSLFSTTRIEKNLQTPVQLSPADGTVFNHYPRKTTLTWRQVTGDVKYSVEIDVHTNLGWQSENGRRGMIVPEISGTSYTFEFVGAQPGRWRVWAIDTHGGQSEFSSWWSFRYTK
jgi:hypothetical protein